MDDRHHFLGAKVDAEIEHRKDKEIAEGEKALGRAGAKMADTRGKYPRWLASRYGQVFNS